MQHRDLRVNAVHQLQLYQHTDAVPDLHRISGTVLWRREAAEHSMQWRGHHEPHVRAMPCWVLQFRAEHSVFRVPDWHVRC